MNQNTQLRIILSVSDPDSGWTWTEHPVLVSASKQVQRAQDNPPTTVHHVVQW